MHGNAVVCTGGVSGQGSETGVLGPLEKGLRQNLWVNLGILAGFPLGRSLAGVF